MGIDIIHIVFELIETIITLLKWAIILTAVFSTLASFGVIDTRNRLVWTIMDFLDRVTAPILRPIRRVVPYFGSVDISPLIAILLLWALGMVVADLDYRMTFGGGF